MANENQPLFGRNILVTGASGEIGCAIVQSLAQAGARPIIHYSRDVEGARYVLDQINGKGWIVQADLSSEDGAETLWSKSVTAAGRVYGLVNNEPEYR